MTRIRIDIRPWVPADGIRPARGPLLDARRTGLAALAVLAFLALLALGCSRCDVDKPSPHGLSEWDRYGCGRD